MVASGVAGTRFRRMREVVILKTIGGTRSRIAAIFSVEFLLLGATAGLMGTALANAFAALVLKGLLNVEFRFDPVAALSAVAFRRRGVGGRVGRRISHPRAAAARGAAHAGNSAHPRTRADAAIANALPRPRRSSGSD
jgi:predicted lysophospholipase L1 biosynthesis ABC-type transport system permease subunit